MHFLPGKRAIMVVLAVAAVMVLPLVAHADLYGFYGLTNNSQTDTNIGTKQLSVDVIDSGNEVTFRFLNIGSAASSITDIYFDDGSLLGISSVVNRLGVDFSQGASPPDLPGGQNAIWDFVITPFVVSAGFSADSNPPRQPNGVNPGEWVDIVFNLQEGKLFTDVITEIGLGTLRIGIHVQGFDSGGSESFINNPQPGGDFNRVPLPAAAWLMGVGLVRLGFYARKKRQA